MDNNKRHGILWIGFGNHAKRLLPYVIKRGGVKIIYFYHPDKIKALERFGKKANWNLGQAIADPAITDIFITTPNHLHTEYLELALVNKKNIYVEKPITAFLSEAIKISTLIQQHGKIVMVGHNFRREACVRKIKDIIDSDAIGQVVSIYANYSKGIVFSMDKNNWRFNARTHREGPLITVGIHLIDILHYLLGPVESVYATIKNISRQTESPDSNAVLFNFENGATAFLEANYNTPSEEILNIYGTRGSLYVRHGNLYRRKGRDQNCIPSEEILVPLEPIDTFAEEINEFFDATENNSGVETGYKEALNAMSVIEACYQSNHNRQLISLAEVTDEYFKT